VPSLSLRFLDWTLLFGTHIETQTGITRTAMLSVESLLMHWLLAKEDLENTG